ncbi:unnamed protein product [Fusarium venenatum]|uniref:Uncharacterized protein n=1 Tax=Fusarium venenatum TaxID=56646 RepID=A0A2L2T5J9_9HYPO|nr:uncharacterized protein FVRRES_02564 [Fusarium venenatum]CEI66052.1 unnamed protein product [Fusarium venenatum]
MDFYSPLGPAAVNFNCQIRRTFFHNTDSWPMHDSSDPLNGWSIKEVEATSTGPATSDIYGKLFRHLRFVLDGFLGRMESSSVAFELVQLDAADLPRHLAE